MIVFVFYAEFYLTLNCSYFNIKAVIAVDLLQHPIFRYLQELNTPFYMLKTPFCKI